MSMPLRSMAIVLFLSLMTVAPAAQVTQPVLRPPSSVTQDATGDSDRFDGDKMSSMGRFAQLLADGRLEKVIAKARAARARAHGGDKVATVSPGEKLANVADEEDDGGFDDDEDFPDAPQNTQSETSI